MTEIPITVRGDVDDRAIEQLRRCAQAGDAVAGVLCADGHVGYSQPIGGAVAYPDHISPSGVGYDIACIAAGTAVTTQDGCTLPVEAVPPGAPVTCWDGRDMRTATPVAGTIARGRRPTLRLLLRNGRELRCTADHEIRTPLGWRAAAMLRPGDRIACLPYVGLPFTPPTGEIAVAITGSAAAKLEALGLLPLRASDPRLPALLRVLGAVCGDGHLSRDGKAASWYTVVPEDAASIAADLAAIGLRASIHVRAREPGRRDEHCVRVSSIALHALLAALGCPVGRKVDGWDARPMRWLFALPAWLRAQVASGLASAEGTTPALRSGAIAPLAIKQAGTTRNAIDLVVELFASLGFRTGVSVSGPVRGDVTTWVAQVTGGTEEQLRFLRDVGFCHGAEKRRAAAVVASVAWQAAVERDRRSAAIAEAVRLRAAGAGTVRAVITGVAEAHDVPRSLLHHGLYGRGVPRIGKARFTPDTSGEIAWVELALAEPGGQAAVYDVVTGDDAQAFQAGGICVHNCGNKAARTDVRVDDVRDDLPRIMDEVFARISFGVGRNNAEPVDHPVLEAIGRADFRPQRRMVQMASNQLGTVGAGNHYVDLFAGDDGFVWIGVHFGSRGFGHKTASGFLALAAGRAFDERVPDGEMDSPPVLLRADSELGRDYIAAMALAGEYAYAGRDVVVDKVLEILGATATYEVHNHHNFCIAGDQIVPTKEGPKRMDQIVEGDEVYAYSDAGPNPTRVVAHWRSGERPVYTLSLGSRRLKCSGQHPILVIDEGRVAWRDAAELAVGDVVVCADGYYPNTVSWGVDRARLTGAFLGDGWIRHGQTERRGYTLGLAIGTGEEPHTHRYAQLATDLLPNDGWGKGWQIDARGHFGLSCSSKSAWTTAVEMGLGERSRQKRLPREAFSLPRAEKLALLAGYFDADGSVASPGTSNHGRGHIASVSPDLVTGLRELALACGLQITSIHRERRHTNHSECVTYRCTIAAGSMAEIPLWHEAKSANQRAPTRASKGLSRQYLGGVTLPDGFFARRVRDIVVGEPEPVYDLTVAHDSHSFIVEGVVTHNCWRERHHGVDAWVIRKGCTPAFPGQEGFVGATMGEPSVVLRGTDDPGGAGLLYSTVHGAGRVMSRTKAAGRMGNRAECSERDCPTWVSWAQYRHERERAGVPEGERFTTCAEHPEGRMTKRRGRIKAGEIDFGAVQSSLAASGIELRGGAADEAPAAYKRLDAVLAAHGDTIEILHRLTPIGVAMAAADTFDPYKD